MSELSSITKFNEIDDLLDRFTKEWDDGGYERGADSPVGWETWKWEYQQHLQNEFLEEHEVTELTAKDIELLIEVLDERVAIDNRIPVYMLGGGANGGIAWRDFKEISKANPRATAKTLSFFFDPNEEIVERLNAFHEYYSEADTGPGSLLALAACLQMFVHPNQYIHYKWTQMREFFAEFSSYTVDQGFDTEQYSELNKACEQLRGRLQGRIDEPSMLHVQTMIWSWTDLLEEEDSTEDGTVEMSDDVAYYWVNQRNSAERENEYLRSQDTYYTRNLTKLEPGDVLFHYWEGAVRAYSTVEREAYEVSGDELEKAEDNQQYWRVDVDLQFFDQDRGIQTIAPVLRRDDIKQGREKYAINSTGVQSWYLCNLTAAAAEYLLHTYPDAPDAEDQETQYFWVNAEATDWQRKDGETFYPVTNSTGGSRRNREAYETASPDDEVLVYQLSPTKQVVGRAHVTRGLHQEPTNANEDEGDTEKGITLRWDESLDGASWRDVKSDPELETSRLVESDNSFVITELTAQEYERILEVGNQTRFADFTEELAVPASEITVQQEGLHFSDEEWERMQSRVEQALAKGNHVLLFGPPGTGKTKLARQVCENTVGEDDYELVTASADWSTFDTVGGYQTTSQNTLEFEPGVVLDRFHDDEDGTPANEWLIIDELNRADIDKAFGSLFSALTGESVTLPFDESNGDPVQVLDASRRHEEIASNKFFLPEDWRMLATMNTLDKTSLYEMSYAFMRRWAFVPVRVPDLPERDDDDDSELEALVSEYVAAWAANGEVPEAKQHYETVGRIWRAANEERSIGPAIVEDIYRYVAHGSSPEDADYVSPIIMYVFPQLEGLRRNELERLIGKLESIVDDDSGELWTVACDFFQVDVQPSER